MNPSALPPALILILFCLWIGLILGVLRYMSGWATLARVYRTQQGLQGEKHSFRSGSLNGVNFNNCLTLGANRDGLYLSTLFPFSLAFPALADPMAGSDSHGFQRSLLQLYALSVSAGSVHHVQRFGKTGAAAIAGEAQ